MIVCYPLSVSTDYEKVVHRTIQKAFSDNRKVYVAWFKTGKLALQEDTFISLLTAATTGTRSYPQSQAHSAQYTQIPPFGSAERYLQGNAASGSSKQFYNQSSFASGSQHAPQPQGTTENRPFYLSPDSYNYKVVLSSGKTVMLMTHLRNGQISYRIEDVEYLKPGFVVPEIMAIDLLRKYSKTTDTELFILMDGADKLIYQTDKKKEKGWQNSMRLALDETLMLTTRLRKGQLSYEGKDVVVRYLNWRVPEDVVANLTQVFQEITAELFVISDSQGKLRCIVQHGADRFSCRFVPFIDDRSGKTRYGGKLWEYSRPSKQSP